MKLPRVVGGPLLAADNRELIEWIMAEVSSLNSRLTAIEAVLAPTATAEAVPSKDAERLLSAAKVGAKNVVVFGTKEYARRVQSAMSVFAVKKFGRNNYMTRLDGCSLMYAVFSEASN